LPQGAVSQFEKVIILDNGEMQFAILADQIEGVSKIAVDGLVKTLPTLTGIRGEFLKGIANQRLIVLDGEKLLHSTALLVNETV
jgi:purine-binding chemotaxis protein CheW